VNPSFSLPDWLTITPPPGKSVRAGSRSLTPSLGQLADGQWLVGLQILEQEFLARGLQQAQHGLVFRTWSSEKSL
jgi:hypothetical protein